MPDVHDEATRSRNMSAIRAKNTRPELALRKSLHAMGFRYRLHVKHLPGKPDLVFPGLSSVVFVHGCFWHHHDCRFFRLPTERREFWDRKIKSNVARDAKAIERLEAAGWRTAVVWECALKSPNLASTVDVVSTWLRARRGTRLMVP